MRGFATFACRLPFSSLFLLFLSIFPPLFSLLPAPCACGFRELRGGSQSYLSLSSEGWAADAAQAQRPRPVCLRIPRAAGAGPSLSLQKAWLQTQPNHKAPGQCEFCPPSSSRRAARPARKSIVEVDPNIQFRGVELLRHPSPLLHPLLLPPHYQCLPRFLVYKGIPIPCLLL